MTCDFSDALRIGFEQALQTFYSITEEADLALERFYRFCQVHYKRSLTRVHRNHGVIPAAEENDFYSLGLRLLEMKTKPEFDEVIETIHTQYPNTKKWTEWYLHPSRAKHIFPAMTVHDNSAMAKDTNAQESIGGDIKRSSGKSKISAVEAGRHAVAYMRRIEEDYQLAITGTQLRYKKNKKIVNKKVSWKAGDIYTNDGRAPDTTKTLLPTLKRKTRMGRPKGSRNKVPKVDIIAKTFGIPWQFEYNGFIGKNTCSLDTTLTAWYLLHKYRAAQLPTAVQNTPAGIVLSDVLDKIDQGDYDHARWLWYTQVLNRKATGTHDLFLSTKEAFLDCLPGLTGFEVNLSARCSNSDCPHPMYSTRNRLVCIALHHPHVTQDRLNAALTPVDGTCKAEKRNIPIKKRRTYNLRTVLNSDNEEISEWYSCSGTMKFNPMEFVSPTPYLLIVDLLQHFANRSQPVHMPDRSLMLDGSKYHIGAIIYANGHHFCCSVFMNGGVLFYDGTKRPRVHWLDPNKIKHPVGYYMVNVWYLKSNGLSSLLSVKTQDQETKDTESLPDVQTTDQETDMESLPDVQTLDQDTNTEPPPDVKTSMQWTELENNTPKLPLRQKVEALSIRQLARQIKKPEQSRQTKQSKQSHPVGISFSLVGQKGTKPMCKACGQQIEQGANRLVLREITNVVKGWSSSSHYHLNSSCVAAAPPKYQAQVKRAPEYQEQIAFEVDSHTE
ncbi:hypothetical protein MVEG_11710 [Podila verticillata NRRL 6337]|uniref:Uncharacterized protein n=1 Tax=Podila verticillata NRRL 6337 TaxID=1069443 RepID=A0A086TJE4_9FUNG|nr:hypothetical protein MVEG_11710 [Podila verticillata NRRL 6337]